MKRTLVIISQVYHPDPAAVGQQIADVAQEMARRGWAVVVYTSARGYEDPTIRYANRETIDGVAIRRLPLSSFGKRSIPVRLAAQALFLVQAILRSVWTPCISALLVSTSPPSAGFAGALVAGARRVPFTWWVMDVNPDQIMVTSGLSTRHLLVRAFQWLNRFTLKRASALVTLDRFMLARLGHQSVKTAAIYVIPPWAKTQVGQVATADALPFRRRHGLEGAFVVMYAGNHAIQHPLKTLLDAAQVLKNNSKIVFVFIGGGAGKANVEESIASGARNVISLPFQPAGTLRATLGAADLHVVSMGDDAVGIVHPCKIYGAMAVGRPILFFGPQDSHGGELVSNHSIGWRVAHGDVESTVRTILAAADLPANDLEAIGRRAAETVRCHFAPHELRGMVCDVIERTVTDGDSD